MAAQGIHKITADFEQAICKYTGAKYAVALDNGSNALFLALYYELHIKTGLYHKLRISSSNFKIQIPCNTYPSVPCEVIHAGGKINFSNEGYDIKNGWLTGPYRLWPTNVIDSALWFTHDMYVHNTHMCLSFTGPYKTLKLGKGGAILTDDICAYRWFKKARFSGRDECSYHEDNFDNDPVIGWNFYMMPEIAARGLLLMGQFYNQDGTPKDNDKLSLPYPDLSQFKIYQK